MKKVNVARLRSVFKELAGKYPLLRLAYLHGSHVTATPTPLSDVDIALIVDEKQGKKGFWDLEIEMEEILERKFPDDDFDVRVMNLAPVDYQGKAITDGVLLYALKDRFRAEYEERARKLYFDFKPFIDAYCEERLSTIRREGLTHG